MGWNQAAADRWAKTRSLRLSRTSGRCLHRLQRAKCPSIYHSCPSPNNYVLLDHAHLWLQNGRPVIILAHSYGKMEEIQELAPTYAAQYGMKVIIGDPEDAWYGAGTIPIRYQHPDYPLAPDEIRRHGVVTKHDDGLRSSKRGERDAKLFPEAHAAALRQRTPTCYYIHVGRTRVTITHDYFFLPIEMSTNIVEFYRQYVRWWAREHKRSFPRHGIMTSSFRDYCYVMVLREHAPWWIQLFREAAQFCVNPHEHESDYRTRMM